MENGLAYRKMIGDKLIMYKKFLFAAMLAFFAMEVSAEEYLKNMDFSQGLSSWLAPRNLNLPDGEK